MGARRKNGAGFHIEQNGGECGRTHGVIVALCFIVTLLCLLLFRCVFQRADCADRNAEPVEHRGKGDIEPAVIVASLALHADEAG